MKKLSALFWFILLYTYSAFGVATVTLDLSQVPGVSTSSIVRFQQTFEPIFGGPVSTIGGSIPVTPSAGSISTTLSSGTYDVAVGAYAAKISVPVSGTWTVFQLQTNKMSSTILGRSLLAASDFNTLQNALPPTLDRLGSTPLIQVGSFPAGGLVSEWLTPPMGYNSWLQVGTDINEYSASNTIAAMVGTGMVKAGYTVFSMDDGWAGIRDVNGNIVPTLVNGTFTPSSYIANVFPSGMKFLADMAHSNGMKFGLYTVIGTSTCAGFTGSAGHIAQDARTYCSWGVDYMKIETCSSPQSGDVQGNRLIVVDTWGYARQQYEAFANAFSETNHRPVFLNFSWWANVEPWIATEANSWRFIGDSVNTPSGFLCWKDCMMHFDALALMSPQFTRPGHYVDPDAVVADILSVNQLRSVLSAYAMMSAPIFVDSVSNPNILINPGMISVDQDSLVQPAHTIGTNQWLGSVSQPGLWSTQDFVASGGTVTNASAWQFPSGSTNQTWVKNLARIDGPRKAVMFLNRATNVSSTTFTIKWSDLGYVSNTIASVFDCWSNCYVGNFTNSYTATIGGQDAGLLIVDSAKLTPVPLPLTPLTYVSDFGWLAGSVNGGGFLAGKDVRIDGAQININGTTYTKGIGLFSPSTTVFYLGGNAGRFHSDFGYDPVAGGSSTGVFQVWGDGVKLFDSGTVVKSALGTVDVSVIGVTNLSLVTTTVVASGNDITAWGGATVSYVVNGDGSGLTNINSSAFSGSTFSSDIFFVWKNGALQSATVLTNGTFGTLAPVLSIPGIGPYFDSSVVPSLGTNGAGNIATWYDLVSGTNNMVQPVPLKQPYATNWLSTKAVYFNNPYSGSPVTNFFTFASPQNQSNFSFFALVINDAQTGYPANEEVWAIPSGPTWTSPFANFMMRYDTSGNFKPWINQGQAQSIAALNVSILQTNFMFLIVTNGTSNVFYLSDVREGTAANSAYVAPSTQPFYVGGLPPPNYAISEMFQGKIVVMGYVNRPITTNEMLQIRTNIETRLGLPVL